MPSHLPVIVSFGGYNAAGRGSGHIAYQRMIYESLGAGAQAHTVKALASLMGLGGSDEAAVLAGTLIRKIEKTHFDPDATPIGLNFTLLNTAGKVQFELGARQLPDHIPHNWELHPLDEEGKRFRVEVSGSFDARTEVYTASLVKAAGQLPSGFDPGTYYRSTHHPRGLQMTVMAASDAIHNLGIAWQDVLAAINPDQIAVYSSSVMSQLDQPGFGGMMSSRAQGQRASSKQLSLGFTSMPGDFTNAYVLGSLGATGAVTGACATFLYNLRWAVEEIRCGRRKVAVVGCSEAPILPEVIDGFAAMSALATDADLCKLDGTKVPDYRRSSRPFGDNCGFTLGESSQYLVLMADDLAMELGADVLGAVPGVYVNADGFKKSISAPGAGNYVTMAMATGLARTLLGEDALRRHSFIQAHGSSTPQNRVTESKIFDSVAAAHGIEAWPVGAVKAYLGHSLGPASGDQMNATLGVFAHGVLPGIKTVIKPADDVHAGRLRISAKDAELDKPQIAFLNSKGFGGNNATATVFSPSVVKSYLARHHGQKAYDRWLKNRDTTLSSRARYLESADAGKLQAIYEFGTGMIDEERLQIDAESLGVPGYQHKIPTAIDEGFGKF